MDIAVQADRVGTRIRSRRGLRILLYAKLLVLDTGSIMLGFALASLLFPVRDPLFSAWQVTALVVPVFFCFAVSSDTYSKHAIDHSFNNRSKVLTAFIYAVLTIVLFIFVTHSADKVSRLALGAGAVASFALLFAIRSIYIHYVLDSLRAALQNEVLIIDDVPILEPLGRFSFRLREFGLEPDLSNPAMLHSIGLILSGFDRAVVACSSERRDAWVLLLRGANIQGELLVDDRHGDTTIGIGRYGSGMTHIVSRGPLSTSNRARKRALDLLLTVPLLLLLIPLMVLVAVLIKLDSKGPVFFRQSRVGRGNQLFQILKFRSMRVEQSDVTGSRSASRDDDRITRIGRIIRRTSIDEIPQLLNVLKGDMSLVGPRPHALGSLAGDKFFWEVDHRYWLRHSLKPGITGLAQVRGLRGATAERADLERRLAADLEYVQHWTLMREVKILCRTFLVLLHRNAY